MNDPGNRGTGPARTLVLLVTTAMLGVAPRATRAGFTVHESDKVKVEAEIRSQVWATSAEIGIIAGQEGGVLVPGKVGPGRLQMALRYERLRTERPETDDVRIQRTTAGASYFPKGHDRKLQADYTWAREEPREAENDQLRLALVAVF